MERLQKLITENEDWLVRRILEYARKRDYVKYTSTLIEAWRISIANLSQTILTALQHYPEPPELGPDEDYNQDVIATFGIKEARNHRSRGLTLGMFLSLMKYYRQSYIDLITQADLAPAQKESYRLFVDRCFDRIELGLAIEWAAATENERLRELQATNRSLANEKNKFLTIFESLHDPVIFLDQNNRVVNMNHAAAELFIGPGRPGDNYYGEQPTLTPFPWLTRALDDFIAGIEPKRNLEQLIETQDGPRHFHVKLERMLDVSEKFSGTVVLLNDLTERKQAAIREERERLARELHDSATQSLYSLTLFAEWSQGLLDTGQLPLARKKITRIGEIAQQALREMRLLLYELRPAALEQDGLIGALQGRLSAVEQRVGVQVELQAKPSMTLPAHIEECLYRIAQEALNNALKHADATAVTIALAASESEVTLTVTDNGKGFDPRQQHNGGMGLTNMRTRAERLGGTMNITSTGAGTTVSVQIAPNNRLDRLEQNRIQIASEPTP